MATERSIDENRTRNEKQFVLSGDPNKAMQQMMDTIDTLRAVYVEENEALDAADTKKFMGLQDRKIAAAQDYHAGIGQILERKTDLSHINQALKQQLIDRQEEFSGIIAENLKSLDLVRKSVKRLNERIMSSAREAARTKNTNYSAEGRLNKNERPVSIGLSESA